MLVLGLIKLQSPGALIIYIKRGYAKKFVLNKVY